MEKGSPIDKRPTRGTHPHHLSQRIELVREPMAPEPLLPEQVRLHERSGYCVECLLAGRIRFAVDAPSQPDSRRLPLCSECIAGDESQEPSNRSHS